MPLTILLHSSKTMVMTPSEHDLSKPRFIQEAADLHDYIKGLSSIQLQKNMHVSAKLADDVKALFQEWKADGSNSAAVETFRGDIYSGLRASDFTDKERRFAQDHLFMLSGMYGVLRPYDAVMPYRLEAGYTFANLNVYAFWSDRLAKLVPEVGPIINVTSVEYDRLVLPYIDKARVITPKFLTIMPGKSESKFVAVHAKIARGAYARWMIQRGRNDADDLEDFNDLGYEYDAAQSTPRQPVYICRHFEGIGLSQRLI